MQAADGADGRVHCSAAGGWVTLSGIAFASNGSVSLPMTLASNWVAYGAGYERPSYIKSTDGVVTLQGLVKDGQAGAIATLPAGFRPAEKLCGLPPHVYLR